MLLDTGQLNFIFKKLFLDLCCFLNNVNASQDKASIPVKVT